MRTKARYMEASNGVTFPHKGWIVRPFKPAWQNNVEAKDFISRNFGSIFKPEKTLKDDHRSFVGIFKDGDNTYITKNFKLQHNRLGFRFASIFYPSLGEVTCKNALELNHAGIKTPPPDFLIQRVKFATIRDSWLVYKYVPGKEIKTDKQLCIVDFVKNMHKLGWIHRDTNPTNFLMTKEGMITIDPLCVRKSNSPMGRALDVLHLEADIPGALAHYGRNDLGIWLVMAGLWRSFMRHYRDFKLNVRRLLGRKEHSGIR